jgi:hypothetical protein
MSVHVKFRDARGAEVTVATAGVRATRPRPQEPPAADVEALRAGGWTVDRAGAWIHERIRGVIWWRHYASEAGPPGWSACRPWTIDDGTPPGGSWAEAPDLGGDGTLSEVCEAARLRWRP